jgi:2-methylisocitrate lyase-like PEP mutase family enzyme
MTSLSQDCAGRAFMAMHMAPDGFILPNAWDAGSAIMLAAEGFSALATTSAGIAFSLGKQDYMISERSLAVSREAMFARIGEIVAAVTLPVNGDLEAGWGPAPEDVAQTIRMAIDVGLAGGNIEDKVPDASALFDETLAVERIAAAAEVIRQRRASFVLTARTDVLAFAGAEALGACIRRANRFLEAGADCVYTVGAEDLDTIRTLAREIDGPLNIVTGLGRAPVDVRAVLDAGAQRVSLGGSIARSTLSFVRRCARELRENGSAAFADRQIPQAELNRLFAQAHGLR